MVFVCSIKKKKKNPSVSKAGKLGLADSVTAHYCDFTDNLYFIIIFFFFLQLCSGKMCLCIILAPGNDALLVAFRA